MSKTLIPFIFVGAILSGEALSSVPKEAFTFDYNVKTHRMSRTKEDKVFKALELIRHVLTTEEFRNRIYNYQSRGRKSFGNNNGLSNHEVYWKILAGAERLNPTKNNTMDMEVHLYTDYDSTVIGYTWPRTYKIWMNSKYFNRRSPAQIAGTLVHEWLHKIGFGHDYHVTRHRKYSVPYAVGNLVEEIAERLETDN